MLLRNVVRVIRSKNIYSQIILNNYMNRNHIQFIIAVNVIELNLYL